MSLAKTKNDSPSTSFTGLASVDVNLRMEWSLRAGDETTVPSANDENYLSSHFVGCRCPRRRPDLRTRNKEKVLSGLEFRVESTERS